MGYLSGKTKKIKSFLIKNDFIFMLIFIYDLPPLPPYEKSALILDDNNFWNVDS